MGTAILLKENITFKAMQITWVFKKFAALSLPELYRLLQLRNEVFVVGQNCVYQDLDGKDQEAIHLFGITASGEMVTYCRLFPPEIYFKECAIGRVLTKDAYRGKGLARVMMEQAIRYLFEQWENTGIRISAQLYLKAFYQSLGFRQASEPYLEEEIPHIRMLLEQ
jgi:ElaA protein